jgi:aromatic ring-opening dioxygenase catalytic subunit (LigB family)
MNVVLNDTDNWIHDSFTLKWMFSKKCPPVTFLSINTKYDAAFHAKIGKLL